MLVEAWILKALQVSIQKKPGKVLGEMYLIEDMNPADRMLLDMQILRVLSYVLGSNERYSVKTRRERDTCGAVTNA